jgi:hypothetical protein
VSIGQVAQLDAPPGDGEAEQPVGAPGRLRRKIVVAVVAVAAVVAVSAFATEGLSLAADRVFVETARSQGRVIAPGTQEERLLSAARKICERREHHDTVAERRATRLRPEEIDAVRQTFARDVRGFMTLALQTYCM